MSIQADLRALINCNCNCLWRLCRSGSCSLCFFLYTFWNNPYLLWRTSWEIPFSILSCYLLVVSLENFCQSSISWPHSERELEVEIGLLSSVFSRASLTVHNSRGFLFQITFHITGFHLEMYKKRRTKTSINKNEKVCISRCIKLLTKNILQIFVVFLTGFFNSSSYFYWKSKQSE